MYRSTSMEIDEPLSWALALLALAVAFGGVRIVDPGFYASPVFVGVLIGFVGHELMHRMVAIRYGYHARFIAYIPGLLVTLASGFIPGLVILAPGYVAVAAYSYLPRPGQGVYLSVAAGPAFNIAASILALAASIPLEGAAAAYAATIAWVNAWMAFFNLLPVPPLDGSKIIRWNTGLWAAMTALSVVLLAVSG